MTGFLGRVLKRRVMEAHGQDILDGMEERGESPGDVADKFWTETYFKLPPAAQERFKRMAANHGGDNILTEKDKPREVLDMPSKVEQLEGTERGFVALMKEGNDRFAEPTRQAIESKGATHATDEQHEQSRVRPERENGDAGRKTAEAGGGDRVQPAAKSEEADGSTAGGQGDQSGLKPLDHGELSIPNRTSTIDADLDRYKREKASNERKAQKMSALERREAKIKAKALFEQLWPAMKEKMGARFGEKELRDTLDSMVKWEPKKFVAIAEKFQADSGDVMFSRRTTNAGEGAAAPEIVVTEGKGLIKGKFLSAVDGKGTPGGPWESKLAAQQAAEAWRARLQQAASAANVERARKDRLVQKLRDGHEPTISEVESIGLRARGSDLTYFIPAAAELFGISSRAVRPLIKDIIRVGHTDMGAKRESVNPIKALMQMARPSQDIPGAANFSRRTSAQEQAARNAITELSKLDDMFQLPKSDKNTIEGIAADNDPQVKVEKGKDNVATRSVWNLTFPDGEKATITMRPYDPDVEAHYEMTLADGDAKGVSTERPGNKGEKRRTRTTCGSTRRT
jgi:hypothetical protein